MRVFRLLLIAALSTGALLVIAPAAGAAASTKACTTLQNLADDLGEVDTPTNPKDIADLQDTYDDLGDAYKKAAKSAPKQVKKALTTIGKVYSSIGDGDASSIADLASKKYGNAVRKYTAFLVTSCSAS